MDLSSFIKTKGLEADYRGSIRFNKVNWGSFVNEIMEWSYNDYEITDTAIRLALKFYQHIPIESIILDRDNGGKVLKSVYLERLSLITGLSVDNPSLLRAVLKVPEGLGCINLFNVVSEERKGIYKPMYRAVAHRPITYEQMIKYGHKAICFNRYDGDVYIDLERRTIHWECMENLYPLHSPLLSFITEKINKYFFSNKDAGGVIVEPSKQYSFGDGKDTVFGSFSSLGYHYSIGVNGLFIYRDWKDNFQEEKINRKHMSGLDCPKCQSTIFQMKNSWSCIGCDFEIPYVCENKHISESLALEYIDKIAV